MTGFTLSSRSSCINLQKTNITRGGYSTRLVSLVIWLFGSDLSPKGILQTKFTSQNIVLKHVKPCLNSAYRWGVRSFRVISLKINLLKIWKFAYI